MQCAHPFASACARCGTDLPPAARFCPQCGRPASASAPATPAVPRHLAERILDARAAIEGERKQVTVLFSDMKGSLGEQLAVPGTTRLTAATLALAEGYVDVKPLGPIPVKGLPDPVQAYELADESDARTRLQARRARGLTRFVGRDSEIEQPCRAAERVAAGHGQVVAVVRQAGVGKTRLSFEFTRSHHMHDWRVIEASSVSFARSRGSMKTRCAARSQGRTVNGTRVFNVAKPLLRRMFAGRPPFRVWEVVQPAADGDG
jgi:hypothetical protein